MVFFDRAYSHLREEWSTYAVGAICAGVIYFCGYMASRGNEKPRRDSIVIGDSRTNLEKKVQKKGEIGEIGEVLNLWNLGMSKYRLTRFQ